MENNVMLDIETLGTNPKESPIIQIGLNTGPVAAAVLGTRAVNWSLFGGEQSGTHRLGKRSCYVYPNLFRHCERRVANVFRQPPLSCPSVPEHGRTTSVGPLSSALAARTHALQGKGVAVHFVAQQPHSRNHAGKTSGRCPGMRASHDTRRALVP